MRNRFILTRLLSLMCLALPAFGNGVAVTNVALTPVGGGKASIQFDLGWSNSWRDAVNYDACWLFAKYSIDDGVTWHHANLSTNGVNPAGFSAGSMAGLEVSVPGDLKGAFIQRSGEGSGDVQSQGVQLSWNFAADGVSANANARVRVFAVEMVYVPAGPFYCGSDDPQLVGTNVYPQSAFMVTYINTADMTKTNQESGAGTFASPYVNATAGMGRPYGVTGAFHANYPNGYNAFYMMKYEMSQGQFADMLRTVSYAQALNNYANVAGTLYTVTGTFNSASALFTVTVATPDRTLGFANDGYQVMHGLAYADWAALRPFTELEYEKACRGPDLPASLDMPWGPTNSYIYTGVTNAGKPTEAPTNLLANANFAGAAPKGPIRNGAFATASSDRVKAGASYYGIFELAGNVSERVVASGPSGRIGAAGTLYFNGSPGDGELDSQGFANNTNWPAGFAANPRNQPLGHRGLGFNHPWYQSMPAARLYGTADYPYLGYDDYGFRCARTAN